MVLSVGAIDYGVRPTVRRCWGALAAVGVGLTFGVSSAPGGWASGPTAISLLVPDGVLGPEQVFIVDLTPDGRYWLPRDLAAPDGIRFDRATSTFESLPAPEGRLTADGSTLFFTDRVLGAAVRWDIAAATATGTFQLPAPWGVPGVSDVSHDGHLIGVEACDTVFGFTCSPFLIDTATGASVRVDENLPHPGGFERAGELELSADGATAVFWFSPLTGAYLQLYAYDVASGELELVNPSIDGGPSHGHGADTFALSANGQFVVFLSDAPDLVAGTTTSEPRWYLRDLAADTTTLLPMPASEHNEQDPAISADGTRIAAALDGTIVRSQGTFEAPLLGLHDRMTGETSQLMVAHDGGPPESSLSPFPIAMSDDGTRVGFTSTASNLVPGLPDERHRVYVAEERSIPALSVDDQSTVEPDSGTADMQFAVRLSAPSSQTVTVQWTTVPGTATAPSDFVPSSGTVTFAPGQIVRSVGVSVVGDTVPESTETFSLVLSNPSGASIADGEATGTIVNDDGSCDGVAPTVVGIGTISGTPGRDVILGSSSDDVVDGGGGADLICGGRGDDVIDGGGGADRVLAGAGDDLVRGGAGDDTLLGGTGDDHLIGGAGTDRLDGGRGDDHLVP